MLKKLKWNGSMKNYTGSYRRTFELPDNWNGQEVYFHEIGRAHI